MQAAFEAAAAKERAAEADARRASSQQPTQTAAGCQDLRPDCAIGADLIAGFPTETEDHHAANLSIVRELGIVHGHIFPYSPRPGTPAARMPQVERQTVKRRAAELRALASSTRDAWLASLVENPHAVLAERDGTGYTPHFARVSVPEGTPAGSVITVSPTRFENGLLQ